MAIYIIKEGCLICGADIKGNRTLRYLCTKCNVTFTEKEISNLGKQKELISD